MTDKELKDAAKLAASLYYQIDNPYKKMKSTSTDIIDLPYHRHPTLEVCTMTHKLLKHIESLNLDIAKLKQERLELIHAILPLEENP